MTVINSGNPFALNAYPQVQPYSSLGPGNGNMLGRVPTQQPGMLGRGMPWPEDRLQPTFQASPGAIANAGGGMPSQQPAGSPGGQNPYALTAYSPQASSNPAVNAISGSMSGAPPTASYTQGMSPSSGNGGLLQMLMGGSKNGMGGLLGMLGGPQQGGLLQMLLGNRGQQQAQRPMAGPTSVSPSAAYQGANQRSSWNAITNSNLSPAAKARAMNSQAFGGQSGLTSQGNPGWWDKGSGGGGYNGTGGGGSLL